MHFYATNKIIINLNSQQNIDQSKVHACANKRTTSKQINMEQRDLVTEFYKNSLIISPRYVVRKRKTCSLHSLVAQTNNTSSAIHTSHALHDVKYINLHNCLKICRVFCNNVDVYGFTKFCFILNRTVCTIDMKNMKMISILNYSKKTKLKYKNKQNSSVTPTTSVTNSRNSMSSFTFRCLYEKFASMHRNIRSLYL